MHKPFYKRNLAPQLIAKITEMSNLYQETPGGGHKLRRLCNPRGHAMRACAPPPSKTVPTCAGAGKLTYSVSLVPLAFRRNQLRADGLKLYSPSPGHGVLVVLAHGKIRITRRAGMQLAVGHRQHARPAFRALRRVLAHPE